jgi:Xaa-Pro dipeptidase
MTLQQLFRDHLRERQASLERALAATGFDFLVVSSGAPFRYYGDDHDAPFQGVAHFRGYCPLEGPHHLLKLQPGRRPLLVRFAPADYWEEQAPMADAEIWADGFDLQEAPSVEAAWAALGGPAPGSPRGAYLGDVPERAEALGLAANPAPLVSRLDWDRSFKTDYELQCLEEATAVAARGHRAAREAFLAGADEVAIHHAFVTALGCLDHEQAFPSIVALDPKGAILHYHNKRRTGHGRVLLLDAGARVRGYGSDITRTWTVPGADPRFRALMGEVKHIQRQACAAMRPGVPFQQVHHAAQAELAQVLHRAGILKGDAEEAFDLGITRPFMPHGLGHLLGLTIHDVAGRATGPEGGLRPPPEVYPSLRTTRTLEPRMVSTVEPGLYFIPMLLRQLREGPEAGRFDWKLIDELAPLGGIRFEDNVVVTADGVRNVTQPHLPSWQED